MKFSKDKKNLAIGISFLVISLAIIIFFFIISNHQISDIICSILSVITSIFSTILIITKFDFTEEKHKKFSKIMAIISPIFSYIIIELLNSVNVFMLNVKLILLNIIFVAIIYLLVYVLTNRIKLVLIISNIFAYALAVINYFVTKLRGTPLVPWDILSIKVATKVASTFSFDISPNLIFSTSLLIAIILLALKINYKNSDLKDRLIKSALALILVFSFLISFYFTDMLNAFGVTVNLWKPIEEYKTNGFLVSFMKQSKNLINTEPENYSIDKVKEIIDTMEKESSKDTITKDDIATQATTPNIIVIMDESFSDLRVINDFKTNEEFLPFFYSLKENTIRGNLHVSIFGGSTPNSEWEMLTRQHYGFLTGTFYSLPAIYF